MLGQLCDYGSRPHAGSPGVPGTERGSHYARGVRGSVHAAGGRCLLALWCSAAGRPSGDPGGRGRPADRWAGPASAALRQRGRVPGGIRSGRGRRRAGHRQRRPLGRGLRRRPGGTGGRGRRGGRPAGVGPAPRYAGTRRDRPSGLQLRQLPGGPVRLDEREPEALVTARFGPHLVSAGDIVFADDDECCSSRPSAPRRCWPPRTRSGRPSGTRPAGSGTVRHCASKPPSTTTWPAAPLTRPTPSGGICAAPAAPSKSRTFQAAGRARLEPGTASPPHRIPGGGSGGHLPATAMCGKRPGQIPALACRHRHPIQPRNPKITRCHRLDRRSRTAPARRQPAAADSAREAPARGPRMTTSGSRCAPSRSAPTHARTAGQVCTLTPMTSTERDRVRRACDVGQEALSAEVGIALSGDVGVFVAAVTSLAGRVRPGPCPAAAASGRRGSCGYLPRPVPGPGVERFQGRAESGAELGQRVVLVVVSAQQACIGELAESLVEHAGGHPVAPGLERSCAQGTISELPQDTQGPAPSEQVQRGHQRPAGPNRAPASPVVVSR